MITKELLVKEIAQKTILTKTQVELVLNQLAQTVKENTDKIVVLPGIGRLKPVVKAARKGVNPKTLEKIDIPEKKTVKFVAAKELLS